MNIIDSWDSGLLGAQLKEPSFWPWRVASKAVYGLPMDSDELTFFQKCTRRMNPPIKPFLEAFFIIGRGGGKSRWADTVLVYKSAFKQGNYTLAPGEVITHMNIASDRKQARVDFRYAAGIFDSVLTLGKMVKSRTSDTLTLKNRTSIEIVTSSFKSVRGYSVGCCVCDELAFWPTEDSVSPDKEIIDGLRPGLGRVPGSLLLCISSPYARRGVLWEAHKKFYGQENDRVLIWVADTKTMNPTFSDEVIQAAYESDPVVAASEYGAQFRRDLEDYVSREAVEACIVPGRLELPYMSAYSYVAFCDPSGGSQDSMTMAIGHREESRAVLDVIRERKPPFSPEDVVREFCETLKAYHIATICGDRYGGEWPRERFRVHGIDYQLAEKSKGEIYQALLPMLNSKAAELLDHPRLVNQICGLERRTGRSGKDSIDHAATSHDDIANSVGGCLVGLALPSEPGMLEYYARMATAEMGEPIPKQPAPQWRNVYEETRRKLAENRERKVRLKAPAGWNRWNPVQTSSGEICQPGDDGLVSVSMDCARELERLGFTAV